MAVLAAQRVLLGCSAWIPGIRHGRPAGHSSQLAANHRWHSEWSQPPWPPRPPSILGTNGFVCAVSFICADFLDFCFFLKY